MLIAMFSSENEIEHPDPRRQRPERRFQIKTWEKMLAQMDMGMDSLEIKRYGQMQ